MALASPEPLRRRAVPYVLVLAFLAILGLSSESIRSVEAVVAAGVFPAVMLYLGFRPLRASTDAWVSRLTLVVAVLAGLASEYFIYRELFPPTALGHTTLTLTKPDATVQLADTDRRFEVVVHGKLRGESGDSEARYTVELQRADRRDKVEGEMTRHKGRAPRRSVGMTRGTGSTSLESGRYEVELDAPGPVGVHLAYLGNGARDALDVTFYPRSLPEKTVAALFGALMLAGLGAQAAAARKGIMTRLTATVAIVGVYTIYLQRYLDADDALMTVLPAMVVSFVVGGTAGLLLGQVAGLFAKKPAK